MKALLHVDLAVSRRVRVVGVLDGRSLSLRKVHSELDGLSTDAAHLRPNAAELREDLAPRLSVFDRLLNAVDIGLANSHLVIARVSLHGEKRSNAPPGLVTLAPPGLQQV